MPYTKTTWKDRVVQNPLTFTVSTAITPGTPFTLVPAEGTITDPGTPITATALNNLETQFDQSIAIDSWIQPTLGNGWTTTLSTFGVPEYTKFANGAVMIRGGMSSGPISTTLAAFLLNTGYRPVNDQYFACVDIDYNIAVIKVGKDGFVYVVKGNPSRIMMSITYQTK